MSLQAGAMSLTRTVPDFRSVALPELPTDRRVKGSEVQRPVHVGEVPEVPSSCYQADVLDHEDGAGFRPIALPEFPAAA